MTGDLKLPSKDPRPAPTMQVMMWITNPKTNEGKWVKNSCAPHNHEFDVMPAQQKLRSLCSRAACIEKAKHLRNHKQLIDGNDNFE